jgi:hypothetical protein
VRQVVGDEDPPIHRYPNAEWTAKPASTFIRAVQELNDFVSAWRRTQCLFALSIRTLSGGKQHARGSASARTAQSSAFGSGKSDPVATRRIVAQWAISSNDQPPGLPGPPRHDGPRRPTETSLVLALGQPLGVSWKFPSPSHE